MKNKFLGIGLSLLLGVTLLSACESNPVNDLNLSNNEIGESYADVLTNQSKTPHGKYNEGVVLVKTNNFNSSMLGELKYDTVNQVYKNSAWYEVKLSTSESTEEAVSYLSNLNLFEKVDFDYVMTCDAIDDSVDISGNAYEPNPAWFKTMAVQEAWKSMKTDGLNPGGDSSVIVAVIDTGVDYNHVDLRNNIWINSAEIPDNGIDDDGNGYIDDVYGWDFVGDDNDPMDDNGHGTHCAGIIAAENNKIGTVGIAYNCKIMCLKASSSSGYLNNSDIAEAIQYAYMNGASIISMSFGGEFLSVAVSEALENAYNQCVLVAAAGNDSKCNEAGCPVHEPSNKVSVTYPASLNYVIGVMSCDNHGKISGFSNFDHYLYNSREYDCYAPGEHIASTFPGNRYASLSGTSMATPQVAAIAALVRSKYQDREIYSNKFITAQLVRGDGYYCCINADVALNDFPTPKINGINNYYIFDNVEFDPSHNNGNGIIESGETIHVGIELMNRGGKATDVTVSLDTTRDEGIVVPYINILSSDICYSEIGTYSIRDAGLIYDGNNNVVDVENPIIVKIADNTPNDYLSVIHTNINYSNGLNANDSTNYTASYDIEFRISNGYILPMIISEDVTFTSNRRYIIANDVNISSGVNVTFEEGCEVQFYVENQGYKDTLYNSPQINIFGNLSFNGSSDNQIYIHPSELFFQFACIFHMENGCTLSFDYCKLENVSNTRNASFNHCEIISSGEAPTGHFHTLIYSAANTELNYTPTFGTFDNCYINMGDCGRLTAYSLTNSVLICTSGRSNNVNFEGDNCVVRNNLFAFTSPLEVPNPEKSQISVYASNIIFDNNVFTNITDAIRIANIPSFDPRDSLPECFTRNVFLNKMIDYMPLVIDNYVTPDGKIVIENDIENHDGSVIWPYVTDIKLFDSNGQTVRKVGSGQTTVKVTFNRSIDKNSDFKLYYGSAYPYRDYAISGEFNDDGTEWIGSFDVRAFIEGGTQYFSIKGGYASNDRSKQVLNNAAAFTFTIDMSSTLSMNIQAEPLDNGIGLVWVQDDYDTLMGYNVYRSESKDGNYIRINQSLISPEENSFVDENAEPGKTYWYTFTVVLSDMTESAPAGKISCTATDTIAPNIYHTPVNQGYLNNNLVISCTASDNIGIQNVTLYYRTKGSVTWKSIEMLRQNDKFSATIFGSELTLDGIEYYIVASDGYNTISKGSAENSYNVIIKDASSISRIGDVDGDGAVTTKDALMIMQAINGDLLLSDDQFIRADLNSDGLLSSVEALRILQYINGNVSSLEM